MNSPDDALFEIQERLLLYMDILGARDLISTSKNIEAPYLMKDLVTIFYEMNGHAKEESLPLYRQCDLLLSSTASEEANIYSLPINSEAAYIRMNEELFYIDKIQKTFEHIVLEESVLKQFDCILTVETLKLDEPRILTNEDLSCIREITKHDKPKGILKFSSPVISSFSDHIVMSFPVPKVHIPFKSNGDSALSRTAIPVQTER